jgi:hypothetical protein
MIVGDATGITVTDAETVFVLLAASVTVAVTVYVPSFR